MPKIDKVLTLEISPEQFLNSCSATELQEIDLLIQSPRFRNKMGSEIQEPRSESEPFPFPKTFVEAGRFLGVAGEKLKFKIPTYEKIMEPSENQLERSLGKQVAQAADELLDEYINKNGPEYRKPDRIVFYMPSLMINAFKHFYGKGLGISDTPGNERFAGIEIREGYEPLIVLTAKGSSAIFFPDLTMKSDLNGIQFIQIKNPELDKDIYELDSKPIMNRPLPNPPFKE